MLSVQFAGVNARMDDLRADLTAEIVERTYEPHRFTVGMPGKPPSAAHVTPDAPDEPPADPSAVGNP